MNKIENPFEIGPAALLDEIQNPFEIGAATFMYEPPTLR
jgi:hypothetical protein